MIYTTGTIDFKVQYTQSKRGEKQPVNYSQSL